MEAHRDDGKRYVVRADEILTEFMELESATRCENLNKSTHEQKEG